MTPLKIGACLRATEITTCRDWLFEADRDIELQDFMTHAALTIEYDDRIAAAKGALAGHRGRVGIHGPYEGLDIDNKDAEKRIGDFGAPGSLAAAVFMRDAFHSRSPSRRGPESPGWQAAGRPDRDGTSRRLLDRPPLVYRGNPILGLSPPAWPALGAIETGHDERILQAPA